MPTTTFVGAKGGVGTTVTACAFALQRAAQGVPVTLVDGASGDVAAALGVPEPEDATGWPVEVAPNLRLLRAPSGWTNDELEKVLFEGGEIVIDAGTAHAFMDRPLGDRVVLVTRPCYLALRRGLAAPFTADSVVVVGEPARALRRADVEDVLGIPVAVAVPWKPAVATAVDAGLLARRVPKGLEALGALAEAAE